MRHDFNVIDELKWKENADEVLRAWRKIVSRTPLPDIERADDRKCT